MTIEDFIKDPSLIRQARKKLDITIPILSVKTGIDCSTISRFENGIKRIRGTHIRSICNALNITLIEI